MALKLQSRDLYTLLSAGNLTPDETHSAYNALDSAITLRVQHALASRITGSNTLHAATAYSFTRAMQGPALDMMRRGIAVNQKVRQDETERYLTLRDNAQRLLNRFADAVWGPEIYTETTKHQEIYQPVGKRGNLLSPRNRTISTTVERERPRGLNASSTKQCLAFFNTALNRPVEYEIRKTPQGRERTPTANDKALRKWAEQRTKGPGVLPRNASVYPVQLARPFVSLILTIREMDKNLQVLKVPLEPNSRMSCSYNVAGTENWRWCLSGGHEVLTKSGWVRLDSWGGGDIAQWSEDGNLTFLNAEAQEFPNDEELIFINSRRVSLLTTAKHRQPYYTGKGKLLVATVGERKTLHSVPVGGHLQGEFLPEDMTRICVMMQADGCNVNDRLIRFHFSKERKIIRCQQLLADFKIPYKSTRSADNTSTYIYIYDPPQWMQIAKFFDKWLLFHSPRTFCDELKHWDGYWTGTATAYYTKELSNAEWVKTMGHLNGQFTSIFLEDKTNPNWAGSYRCTLTVDTTTRFGKETYANSGEAPDKVYCPATQTGFFLVRHDGMIVVTGNSSSANAFGRGTNLQNITASMRRMFCADDGYRMISTDLEQAESYIVAGLVWECTGDDTYWRAILSGDLHTQVCRMAWPEMDWKGNKEHDRPLADSAYPSLGMSYRDVAKRIGHGSNYNGSSFGIAAAVGLPRDVVEDFQSRYFRAFPSIRSWHAEVRRQLLNHQYLDTPLGTRRWFFSRPSEDSTLREAIACVPQGTVALLLNLIMWKCWRRSKLPPSHPNHLPIQLLLQNHDAFLFQTPLDVPLETLIPSVNSEFTSSSVPFTRGVERRMMSIPGEFVTGFNWAYKDNDPDPGQWTFKDGNPDGLSKWRGSDTRIRQQTASPSLGDWLSRPLP